MEGEGDYERVPPASVEKSAACEKTALEMEDLPNEMLKSILEKLVADPDRWSQKSWNSNFQSVIAYRQVCSTWRDFLDEILEKSLLSTVRVWCPPYHFWDSNPIPLSKVPISEITEIIGLEEDEISCPPPLIGYNGSNPFPGKAVEVGFEYGCRDVELWTQTTINLMDLFTKAGHHLSFLHLHGLTIVDLDVLVSILERCPNLKALVIRDLTVRKDKSPRSPPALPQLKTLVIEYVRTGPTVNSRFRLIPSFSQWLVEPYACQLVQLLDDVLAPVTSPLPNLKQLTLHFPKLIDLQQSGPAVSLLRLCVFIEGEKCSYDWKGNIYDMFEYLDRFSKTLVDLFLSVYWSDLIPEASDDNEVEEDDQEEQQRQDPLVEELQKVYGKLPTSKVKFPHLKTLAFPYPSMEIHMMLLSQTVLPKFRALEELTFLHFWQSLDKSLLYEQSRFRETIAEFFEREDYWTICPKLKKITVLVHEDPTNIYFTCRRPVVI